MRKWGAGGGGGFVSEYQINETSARSTVPEQAPAMQPPHQSKIFEEDGGGFYAIQYRISATVPMPTASAPNKLPFLYQQMSRVGKVAIRNRLSPEMLSLAVREQQIGRDQRGEHGNGHEGEPARQEPAAVRAPPAA